MRYFFGTLINMQIYRIFSRLDTTEIRRLNYLVGVPPINVWIESHGHIK